MAKLEFNLIATLQLDEAELVVISQALHLYRKTGNADMMHAINIHESGINQPVARDLHNLISEVL